VFLLLTLVSLVTFLLSNFNILPIGAQGSFSVVSAVMVVVIFYLSLHGIRQASVGEYYSGPQLAATLERNTTVEVPDPKEKYKTSSLTRIDQEAIYGMLVKLFETDSIYQESKLQLSDVADRLQVPAHNLSQTINTMAGKPFYDFVNSYRVRYFQKLLEDAGQRRFTILALGLQSGFNSKASLNRVFKEHTGLSPSEYQKRHLQK
jgi:AraC-like DNA-binding protein